MARVTDEILRLLKQKDQKILDGQTALAGLLGDVRRQILDELQSVTGESYAAYHLRQNLASIERHLRTFETAATWEISRQIGDAWTGGEEMVLSTGRVGGLFLAFGHIPESVLQTLQDFGMHKISGLAGDTFNKVRGELSLGILGQKTPHQVMTAIAGSLESPGVFKSIEERARVITQVEMGRAYSQATQLGLEAAAQSVPELGKQWWHAGHPRQPRMSHLALHGQIRKIDEPFLVGSLIIRFPRDPKAPASEVIRCGCEVVPYHPNWGDEALPIFNERGREIARRGPRTGDEEPLVGKFALGQRNRKSPPDGSGNRS